MAFLMKEFHMSYENAFDFVQSKIGPIALIEEHEKDLIQYQNELQKQNEKESDEQWSCSRWII